MALVVETGSGSATAESYASVSQADTRLASLGNTLWATMSEAEREQALRRATVFMEQAFRQRWRGTRTLRAQALSWPRYGATVDGFDVSSTTVPADVANACIDLAFKAAAADLAPDTTRLAIREKVGPIEAEYSPYQPQQAVYVAIERALSPYLKGGAAMASLVRA